MQYFWVYHLPLFISFTHPLCSFWRSSHIFFYTCDEWKIIVHRHPIPHANVCQTLVRPPGKNQLHLKPATGRPCILALGDPGTVPAITCDCSPVAELFMRRRYVDLCVTASSRTMLTFENNVSCSSRDCSTIAFCRRYMDVNTLASKRSELLGTADILRMRRVIHNNSTCVCLHIPVAAIT